MKKRIKKDTTKDLSNDIKDLTKAVNALINMIVPTTEVPRAHTEVAGRNDQPRVPEVTTVRPAVDDDAGEEPGVERPADSRGDRKDNKYDIEARRRQEEVELQSGIANAVSSFAPADAPVGVPSRAEQNKLLYAADQNISCQICKMPVYVVNKDIFNTDKISELKQKLKPYDDTVPALTEETHIKMIGGVSLNCPRCMGAWGVVIC